MDCSCSRWARCVRAVTSNQRSNHACISIARSACIFITAKPEAKFIFSSRCRPMNKGDTCTREKFQKKIYHRAQTNDECVQCNTRGNKTTTLASSRRTRGHGASCLVPRGREDGLATQRTRIEECRLLLTYTCGAPHRMDPQINSSEGMQRRAVLAVARAQAPAASFFSAT